MTPTTQQPPFFIVGLPRSRTAWLANFLTYGPAFCLHDGLKDCAQPEDLRAILQRTQAEYPGSADTLLPLHFPRIHALYPDARYVFIYRDRNASQRSCERIMAPYQTPEQTNAQYDRLEAGLQQMKEALCNHHTLSICYDHLDGWQVCQRIWEYCVPGIPFNFGRWKMLDEMQVTINLDKRKAHLDLVQLHQLSQHTTDKTASAVPLPVRHTTPTALHAEYHQAILALCGPDQAAAEWLLQLLNVWLTWDHISDNDPIDKNVAAAAFEAMLLDWPANEFYQAHRVILRPVLANVISAWHNSNGEDRKEYDAYSEVPCAVAFLLGGKARLAQHGPGLRKLVRQIAAEHQQLKT